MGYQGYGGYCGCVTTPVAPTVTCCSGDLVMNNGVSVSYPNPELAVLWDGSQEFEIVETGFSVDPQLLGAWSNPIYGVECSAQYLLVYVGKETDLTATCELYYNKEKVDSKSGVYTSLSTTPHTAIGDRTVCLTDGTNIYTYFDGNFVSVIPISLARIRLLSESEKYVLIIDETSAANTIYILLYEGTMIDEGMLNTTSSSCFYWAGGEHFLVETKEGASRIFHRGNLIDVINSYVNCTGAIQRGGEEFHGFFIVPWADSVSLYKDDHLYRQLSWAGMIATYGPRTTIDPYYDVLYVTYRENNYNFLLAIAENGDVVYDAYIQTLQATSANRTSIQSPGDGERYVSFSASGYNIPPVYAYFINAEYIGRAAPSSFENGYESPGVYYVRRLHSPSGSLGETVHYLSEEIENFGTENSLYVARLIESYSSVYKCASVFVDESLALQRGTIYFYRNGIRVLQPIAYESYGFNALKHGVTVYGRYCLYTASFNDEWFSELYYDDTLLTDEKITSLYPYSEDRGIAYVYDGVLYIYYDGFLVGTVPDVTSAIAYGNFLIPRFNRTSGSTSQYIGKEVWFRGSCISREEIELSSSGSSTIYAVILNCGDFLIYRAMRNTGQGRQHYIYDGIAEERIDCGRVQDAKVKCCVNRVLYDRISDNKTIEVFDSDFGRLRYDAESFELEIDE